MAAPDAEKIVTAYLRGVAAIDAITGGDRIVGKSPSNIARPWVRVTVLDDPSTDGGITDRHVAAYLQLDCFAGTDGDQETAADLKAAVRAALSEIHLASHSEAVVTGPPSGITAPRIPDTSFEPAMERYAISATIYVRSS